MSVPSVNGIKNYYGAAIDSAEEGFEVLTISLDSLQWPAAIKLVKIDAEGHDPVVLRGMRELIRRDHPTVIVETSSPTGIEQLTSEGYKTEQLKGSCNTIFKWVGQR